MDARTTTLLTRAEAALSDLRAHLEQSETAPSDWENWFRRAGAVLVEVDDRGGKVHVDQWREIGKKLGYDPRGLSGFFTGKMPSMRSDGDERIITPKGKRDAEQWREMFGDSKGNG